MTDSKRRTGPISSNCTSRSTTRSAPVPTRGARKLFTVVEEKDLWRVRQTLADPEGDHGWALLGEVNLAESDAAGEVVFDEFEIVEG